MIIYIQIVKNGFGITREIDISGQEHTFIKALDILWDNGYTVLKGEAKDMVRNERLKIYDPFHFDKFEKQLKELMPELKR